MPCGSQNLQKDASDCRISTTSKFYYFTFKIFLPTLIFLPTCSRHEISENLAAIEIKSLQTIHKGTQVLKLRKLRGNPPEEVVTCITPPVPLSITHRISFFPNVRTFEYNENFHVHKTC